VAGITALEMAEGKPPYGDIHPMPNFAFLHVTTVMQYYGSV